MQTHPVANTPAQTHPASKHAPQRPSYFRLPTLCEAWLRWARPAIRRAPLGLPKLAALECNQGLSRCATGAPRHPRWCALFWLAGIGVEPNGNAKPNDDRQLGVPVALASRTR